MSRTVSHMSCGRVASMGARAKAEWFYLMLRADVDEQSKKEIKDLLLSYDRTLLVADPRRCEPKKCAQQKPWLSSCICAKWAPSGFLIMAGLHRLQQRRVDCNHLSTMP